MREFFTETRGGEFGHLINLDIRRQKMDWYRDGNKFTESFRHHLEDPIYLKTRFLEFRDVMGKDFTFDQFLKILDIYSREELARVLGNIPELVSHYLTVMPPFDVQIRD